MTAGIYTRLAAVIAWTVCMNAVSTNAAPPKPTAADLARQETNLKVLLGASEKTPQCSEWKEFDEKTAIRVISETLENEKEAPNVRARAAFALGCFSSPPAGRSLEKVLKEEKTTNLVRGPALVALADSQKGGAVPQIRKALQSKDPQLRIAAVAAAGKAGTKEAKDVLREHLKTEPIPLIQNEIRKILEPQETKK